MTSTRKSASIQAITPEEPPSANPPANPPSKPDSDHLESTRSLEVAIMEAIGDLERSGRDAPIDKAKLVLLLNRSLTAISHWSLQAQLSRLENRTAWDSRLAVENNLIKKEVEFFRNRCLNEAREPVAASPAPKRVGKCRHAKKSDAVPSLLKLVENHKPHPRMRRSSDNPSANEFVRVFHLEKL